MFSKKIIRIIQLCLSALFLISAITKLLSIESFEIFVYNLVNCSYDFTSFLVRFIIGLELLLSILFLYNRYFKMSTLLALGSTLIFSVFLLQHLDITNCYCFGPNFPFTAKASLWKNAGIIFLLTTYFLLNLKQLKFGFKVPKFAMFGFIIIPLLFPFIYNTPNYFMRILKQTQYLQSSKITDSKHIADIKNSLAFYKIPLDSNIIIPILSSQCKYCKAALEMFTAFDTKHQFNSQTQLLVIGDSLSTNNYVTKFSSDKFLYKNLYADHFMAITKGVIPNFLFQKKGVYYLLSSQDLSDAVFEDFKKP